MKDKVLPILKTKLPGVQELLLDGVAAKLAETITDETKIPEVITDGLVTSLKFAQDFIQSETDRKVTTALKTNEATVISNYEKKHNLKDGKPLKEEGKGDDGDTPAWAMKIIEANQGLQNKLSAIEDEKKRNTLNEKLKAKLTGELKIPEQDLKVFNLLSGVTIKEETEIDTVAATIKTTYDESVQKLAEKGVNIAPPKEGNAGAGLIQDIKNWKREEKK